MNDFITLQNKIKYNFKNIDLLKLALTHKSISYKTTKNNQRVEFLGDSVLGVIISDYLYQKFPNYTDGELTRLKSMLVKKETLAKMGNYLSLSDLLIRAENTSIITVSMLEDTVEAIIGAVFLDSDFEECKRVVIFLFEKYFTSEIINRDFLNTKQSFTAELKEYSEKKYKEFPKVKMIQKEGKDNKPTFVMEVTVGDIIEQGRGSSKKLAISDASRKILMKIKNNY